MRVSDEERRAGCCSAKPALMGSSFFGFLQEATRDILGGALTENGREDALKAGGELPGGRRQGPEMRLKAALLPDVILVGGGGAVTPRTVCAVCPVAIRGGKWRLRTRAGVPHRRWPPES